MPTPSNAVRAYRQPLAPMESNGATATVRFVVNASSKPMERQEPFLSRRVEATVVRMPTLESVSSDMGNDSAEARFANELGQMLDSVRSGRLEPLSASERSLAVEASRRSPATGERLRTIIRTLATSIGD